MSKGTRQCVSRRLKELLRSGALAGPTVKLANLSQEDLLLSLARDSRPIVRQVAAECAGEQNKSRNVKLLTKLSADVNSGVRCAAIESVGNLLEGKKSCPLNLFKRLHDREILVRVATASTLPQIKDRRALPRLWRALRDPSPLVRSYVAAAIGQLGRTPDLVRLKKFLKKEHSSAAKIGFFDALYNLGERSFAVEGLTRLLGSRDYRVRCAISNTLGAFHLNRAQKSEVVATLRQVLKKENSGAAREAIRRAMHRLSG